MSEHPQEHPQSKAMTVSEFLMTVRDGGAVEELRNALEQTVLMVRATGKPGKVALTINVRPNGPESVFVKDDIKSTLPIPEKEETFFFVTAEGGLSWKNPSQPSFETLRRVEE